MRASRKDGNQSKIEKALQRVGAQIIDTSMLKINTFDLIVLFRGSVFLLEVKDNLPVSFFSKTKEEKETYLLGKLTENEMKTFHKCQLTNNKLHIVYDVDSALLAIGANSPIFK